MDHLCTGIECKHCGVFAHRRPYYDWSAFRDSRGLPIPHFPDQARVGTNIIILDAKPEAVPPWQVVVQQRADNQYWGWPGGCWEPGETIEACARREVREETGLDVEILRLVSVDSDPTQYAICCYPDAIVHFCCFTFLAVVKAGVLGASPESRQVCWAPTDTLPYPFLRSHALRLDDALRCSEQVILR